MENMITVFKRDNFIFHQSFKANSTDDIILLFFFISYSFS